MAYSIHDHIFCILEAHSKRYNDFSLIGRKPKVFQFKWRGYLALKFKRKINLKFKLKGSKITKIMKGSKNRKRLPQVEAIYVFLYINKQEILIHYDSNRFILLSKLGFLNTFDCLFPYAVSSIFLFVIAIHINCNLWPNVTIPIYGQQNRKLGKHLFKTNCKASIKNYFTNLSTNSKTVKLIRAESTNEVGGTVKPFPESKFK